jgi:hypothetical protein
LLTGVEVARQLVAEADQALEDVGASNPYARTIFSSVVEEAELYVKHPERFDSQYNDAPAAAIPQHQHQQQKQQVDIWSTIAPSSATRITTTANTAGSPVMQATTARPAPAEQRHAPAQKQHPQPSQGTAVPATRAAKPDVAGKTAATAARSKPDLTPASTRDSAVTSAVAGTKPSTSTSSGKGAGDSEVVSRTTTGNTAGERAQPKAASTTVAGANGDKDKPPAEKQQPQGTGSATSTSAQPAAGKPAATGTNTGGQQPKASTAAAPKQQGTKKPVAGKPAAPATVGKVNEQPSGGKKWHHYDDEDVNVDGLIALYIEGDGYDGEWRKVLQEAGEV